MLDLNEGLLIAFLKQVIKMLISISINYFMYIYVFDC